MKDILAELNELKADYSAAQTLLEEAKSAQAAFEAKLADKDAALACKDEALAAAQAAFAAKEQELASQLEAFTALQAEVANLKASQKTVEEKAVEVVAEIGIAPLKEDLKAQAAPTTKAEALALYQAAEGPSAKAAIYKQYKAVLLGR